MQVSKEEYNTLMQRLEDMEKAVQSLVVLLTSGRDEQAEVDESVYTNEDGMYDFQKYKRHARNRRAGSVGNEFD